MFSSVPSFRLVFTVTLTLESDGKECLRFISAVAGGAHVMAVLHVTNSDPPRHVHPKLHKSLSGEQMRPMFGFLTKLLAYFHMLLSHFKPASQSC